MVDYCFYKIGRFIAEHLPLKAAYAVAVFISDVHYCFDWRDRRAVKANLKAIFPGKTDRQIRRIRIEMFRNFAKYLADFLRFSKLDKEYIEKNIKIENIGYFDEALAEGKGVIALSAHLGNWELGAGLVAFLGYPFWAVALPHKYKKVDDFFNAQRRSQGVNVIPLGVAVRQCLKAFKENKIVALVGDRDFNENGPKLDFFGKPTILPQGPAAFALATGARIVPCFMCRNEDDSFTMRIEKPIEFSPCGDKEKDTLALISKYKVIIEDYIRRYPEQWYMFRRFWAQ